MEKPRVIKTDELIERTKNGEGHVVDGGTLLYAIGNLLNNLNVLANAISEAMAESERRDADEIPVIPLHGAGLQLFHQIFASALEVTKVLVDHGAALKAERQASGPADADPPVPSPTVDAIGRA